MSRRSWSVQDAKNQFSAVVEAAKRAPQTVTKHGKPAVVIVDAADYERLRKLEKARAPSFTELLLAMPQDDGSFRAGGDQIQGREVLSPLRCICSIPTFCLNCGSVDAMPTSSRGSN